MNSLKVIWTWALLLSLAWTISGQCFSEEVNAQETDVGVANDGKSIFAGSTKFALDLFNKVLPSKSGAEENVFISPFSIWSALILTYFGANGETKAQMEHALVISPTNRKQVSNQYQDLKEQLLHNATERSNYTFRTANRVYLDRKIEVRNCMIELFQTEVEKLDFKKAPEPSRQIINKWVEEQTNNKIKELIKSKHINPAVTVMILVNAAYFKGYWSSQFLESTTRKQQDFYVSSAITTKVDMMHQVSRFPLFKNSQQQFSAIELPYSGEEVSMIIVLPEKGTKVEDLVPKLTTESLQSIYDGLTYARVDLLLPKFKNEQEFDLKETIKAMGAKDLFDEVRADLSEFTGRKELFVEHVLHKTFIEVNEGGTEAAAATAVIIGFKTTAIRPPSPPPIPFHVDRPFIVLIRNKPTNTILFMGTIRSPKQ